MQQPGSSYPPGGPGQAKRRGLFSGRAPEQPIEPGDTRVEAMIAAYQRSMMDRLEEGLRAIQQTGITLMHEIAGEVWRTAHGDKDEVQSGILAGLARDEAIRGMIAHSDERFQALAVRTARLEDTLNTLADTTRALKEVLAEGARALHDAAASPAFEGVTDLRERMTVLEEHLEATFERLDDRDRILIGNLQDQIRDNSLLIRQETGRIVEALESYVKDGVDAIGRLAQHVEQQSEQVAGTTEAITRQLSERFEEQAHRFDEQARRLEEQADLARTRSEEIAELARAHSDEITERLARTVGEQVQLMHERIGIETRALSDAFKGHEAWILRTLEASSSRLDEGMDAQIERVREASREVAGQLARSIESRVHGLAELVRSDSEVLRRVLRDAAAQQSEEMARALDERLAPVSEALTTATRWTVEETTGRIGRAVEEATRRAGEETVRSLQGRLDEVVTSMDRNMVRLVDTLDTELDRMGQSIGQRSAQAAEAAIEGKFDRSLEKLNATIEAMDRMSDQVDRLERATEGAATRAEDAMTRKLDERIGALARMVRSDNKILVERMQVAADQEPAKQALRAVKELQASLPSDMMEVIDRRFATLTEQLHRDTQAMAESVAKAGEMLGQKVDRIAAQIGQRYDKDMQVVIERMGDAMHALSGLGKPDPNRIELE